MHAEGRITQKEFSEKTEELRRFGPGVREISLPRWNRRDRCPTCHLGLEEISSSHPVETFGCTICHEGNGLSLDKDEAHRGMLGGSNPSRLEVVRNSCGRTTPDGVPCHAGHQRMAKNQAERVPRAIMATMTGVITSFRVTWGAQKIFSPLYATVGVTSLDGTMQLKPAPFFDLAQAPLDAQGNPILTDVLGNSIDISGQYADDQWRKLCSRCHLWYQRESGPSAHSSGCAGCHALYKGDGYYHGRDITLPTDRPGYSAEHRLTTAIPVTQCIRCHNRSGRIAMSYQGLMESDGYGTPYRDGSLRSGEFSGGRSAYHLAADIHWEKGMQCIDCHTGNDTMGDGKLYGRMREQVEIRCRDCHGDNETPPRFTVLKQDDYAVWASDYLAIPPNKPGNEVARTSRNSVLINVRREGNEVALYSKVTGKRHVTPVITGVEGGPHAISGHNRLECFTCHNRWAPQCYGCHDYRRAGQLQYDAMTDSAAPGRWSETRDYFRFMTPPLGINARGKVSPYIPGCQVLFNDLDEKGRIIPPYRNYVYPGNGVLNGIVSTPIFPHTVGRETMNCEECHFDPKSLGLGSAIGSAGLNDASVETVSDPKAAGYPVDFSWESLTDPRGVQLQGNSHQGARPFNQDELKKIRLVGRCLICHDSYQDPIYQDFEKSRADARSSKHQRLEEEVMAGKRTMKYPRILFKGEERDDGAEKH